MVAVRRPATGPSPRPERPPAPALRLWRVIVLATASVVLVLASLVYTQIQISQAGVTTAEMRSRAAAVEVRTELLRAEVAALQSPARIMEEAKRLGLAVPAAAEFLVVAAADR